MALGAVGAAWYGRAVIGGVIGDFLGATECVVEVLGPTHPFPFPLLFHVAFWWSYAHPTHPFYFGD
eukprot:3036886-Rhodomonas_salina.1